MRRLSSVLTIAVAALAVAATAQAATFDPDESLMLLTLGAMTGQNIPPVPGSEGMVSLTDDGFGGHDIVISQSAWNTANFGSNTTIYTGVAVITDLTISIRNEAGSMASGYTHTNFVGDNSVVGPYFGGEAKLSGKLVMWAQGVPAVNFGLAAFGGPAGGTTIATLLGLPITVTGGPWVTGAVPVTGITTNVVSFNGVIGAGVTLRVTVDQTSRALSTGGGFVSTNGGLPLEYHTVTLSGANQLLSADQSGMVTLVSPMRVNSGPAISGRTPGAAWMDLYFVPEPGTVLLLVSGAIGLAVIGRRRMRQ